MNNKLNKILLRMIEDVRHNDQSDCNLADRWEREILAELGQNPLQPVVIKQIEGEKNHEYPHIVSLNGKIHCNKCGSWDWLGYWMKFIDDHKSCASVV